MVFDSVFNFVFSPIMGLPVAWTVIIISLLMSLLITVAYMLLTDQKLMKSLKDEMKSFQKEMRELQHNPNKVLEVQKRAMETNMKYMMHSMKPTLVTFIPLILLFGWMNAYLTYEPIHPDDVFKTSMTFDAGAAGKNTTIIVPDGFKMVSSNSQSIQTKHIEGGWFSSGYDLGFAEWEVKAPSAGEYLLEYKFDGNKYEKEIVVKQKQGYESPKKTVNEGGVKEIALENKQLIVLNLFGWQLGWIGTYIIFSIIFSLSLRKIFNLH